MGKVRSRARCPCYWGGLPIWGGRGGGGALRETDMQRVLSAVLCVALFGLMVGCASDKKPAPRPKTVQPTLQAIPDVLRGTIGSEVAIHGIEPMLVSGYGLVVGLNGTGGGPINASVEAYMTSVMTRNGITRGNSEGPLAGMTAQELLRDPNVAVVLVYAVIPPGAPVGSTFDTYVRSLPESGTTSLEGGTLWTTELQIGPPTEVRGLHTHRIASAHGPVFINPYADPGNEDAGVTRTVGRVLDGGAITKPLKLELALNNPSHARARAIVQAINSRFPTGPGDRGPAARGRNAGSIELTVPHAYRDDPAEFIQLVRHLRINQSYPREYAKRAADALHQEPGLGSDLSWMLQAIGPAAIPFLRELYDDPELVPRMAALRAGARLDDPLAAEHLQELAVSGPPRIRSDAIGLLSDLNASPKLDLTLRDLLGSEELDVRVAAYEALAHRAERVHLNHLLDRFSPRNDGTGPTYQDLVQMASMSLPGDSIQGVFRMPMEGKFFLDVVSAGDPLVYVTQQGTPRIVLFGENLELNRPLYVSVWSDRLLLSAESATDPVRLYYRDYRTGRVTKQPVSTSLVELVRFMAHTPTPEEPEPGLGLTYSEVVGALHAITRSDGLAAAFATEQERLAAQIYSAAEAFVLEDRPETSDEAAPVILLDPVKRTKPERDRPSLVEPVTPKADTHK